MIMTINCNLMESDYRAMKRYVFFKYRKIHWYYAFLLVFLLILTWLGNKPEATMVEKVSGLVGVLLLWVIFMVIFFVFLKVMTNFRGGRFRGSIGPHVFEVTDVGFAESNEEGKIELRLSGIRHIGETKSHFFIITSTGRGHVLPKRDFQDYGALHSLQAILKKR